MIGLRDLALLRAILHAGLIPPKLLLALLEAQGSERSRTAYYNRLKRLRDHGYIEVDPVRLLGVSAACRLTPPGAQQLVDAREPWARHFAEVRSERPAAHWLTLSHLRLVLGRTKLLGTWLSRVDLRYRRHLESAAFVADYDAVVTLRALAGEIQLGLFVEHSLRPAADYDALARQIEQERRLHWALCLVSDDHALHWLRGQFPPGDKHLLITTVDDFQRQGLHTPVYLAGTHHSDTLSRWLVKERQSVFFPGVTQ